MAFTLTPIAAKDSAGVAIGGGLKAADIAGGGVGPFFIFHGLIDGVAGVNVALIDSSNALRIAKQALTPVVSGSLEGSHVLKGSAGTLYNIDCTIGAVGGYLMIINATSAPADGAVTPLKCWPVYSNGSSGYFEKTFNPPLTFSTGITVVFSTTGPYTKTISATAMFSGEIA